MDITGVEYDSRRVVPGVAPGRGVLFAALPGEHTDGRLFARDAVARGAVCVLAAEAVEGVDAPLLIVPDVRAAMAEAAGLVYGDPSGCLKTIGVTGTNGKTTVTYLLESIFREAGEPVGVIGTVNYRYGALVLPAPHTTPEAPDLARLLRQMADGGASGCVMEVSSHALAQKRVEGVRFDAAVFTNLTEEHLDYHETMEGYYGAKALLFRRHLKRAGEGRAVVNVDDRWGARLAAAVGSAGTTTYGLSEGADVHPLSFDLKGSSTEALVAMGGGKTIKLLSTLVGEYNLYNMLAAAAAADLLGVDPGAIAAGIAALARVPGRLEAVDPGGDVPFRAYVDYAHTADALKRTLEALRPVAGGRIITVFGCGGDRDRSKRPVMGSVAAAASDLTIITSDNPRGEDPGAIIEEITAGVVEAGGVEMLDGPEALTNGQRGYSVIPDRHEAISRAVGSAREGDIILVAGKGHEDYQIVGDRRLPFDDRSVLREAIASRVSGPVRAGGGGGD